MYFLKRALSQFWEPIALASDNAIRECNTVTIAQARAIRSPEIAGGIQRPICAIEGIRYLYRAPGGQRFFTAMLKLVRAVRLSKFP